jgi:LPXTG-motif cell wall-anchored protein
MKLMKKVLSVVAAMALVVTLLPVNASAATDVIDFEDGIIPAGIHMAVLEDGSPDGDPSVLSVVDFNGSKMLKIDNQEGGTSKLVFDVPGLVGEDAALSVRGIQYDIIIEQTDGRMVEWNGGTVAATPTGPSGWANGKEWEINYWDDTVSPVTTLSHTLEDFFAFTDVNNCFFLFMNWANNGTDMYIDNVKLTDVDGNAVPFLTSAEAPAEEVEEVEEVEEAQEVEEAEEVQEVAEPAETKEVPKTGYQSYAWFFLVGAVAMLTLALVVRKRKNIVE